MKALVFNGVVVQVEQAEFPVHEALTWHDVDDTVQVGWLYQDGEFSNPEVVDV